MAMPKIAIIGAGPVGCTLARILCLSSIPVTVFESDTSPNYRSQGGTLDLHPKTGLAAIKDAQLWDEFQKHARYDGDYYLMTDQHCKPFVEFGPSRGKGANERPEIDRGDLRKILSESLPEGTVQWGRRLKRVSDDGRTLIFTDDSTEAGFDLVIGADGAWSKVRAHISPDRAKPEYSGIAYYLFEIHQPETAAPELHRLVKGGNLFASSNQAGQRLSIQQMGDGSLHIGWAFRQPDEGWMDKAGQADNEADNDGGGGGGGGSAFDPRDPAQAREAVLRDMRDWDPLLRDAVVRANGRCEPRNLYMLPVGWGWAHRRGATLVGDAAHVMTPFAGEGVNVGLDDARRLAAAIVGAVRRSGEADDVLAEMDAEVEKAEREMQARMERYQKLTDDVSRLWFFREGDLWDCVPDVLYLHISFDMPALLRPLAWFGVKGWWFTKRNFMLTS